MALEISTATTRPYIAIMPDMTTGIIDFMISSGLMTAIAAMPVPDFAVPYAAPNATMRHIYQTIQQCM